MELRDYFRMKCSELLAAENDVLRMGITMAQEVQSPQIKMLLQSQSTPTQQHINNMQMILSRYGGPSTPAKGFMELLGVSGEPTGSPITSTIMHQHQHFQGMNPSHQLIDINALLDFFQVEHSLVAEYLALVAIAKQLGDTESVGLLQQNLDNEASVCDKIQSSLPQMISDIGMPGSMAA